MTWTSGADGQPNVTGVTQTGTDDQGVPIMSAGTPGYDVIIDPAIIPILPEWTQYAVNPPTRVWAGVETVQLQFPDEATAKSVLAGLWVADQAQP